MKERDGWRAAAEAAGTEKRNENKTDRWRWMTIERSSTPPHTHGYIYAHTTIGTKRPTEIHARTHAPKARPPAAARPAPFFGTRFFAARSPFFQPTSTQPSSRVRARTHSRTQKRPATLFYSGLKKTRSSILLATCERRESQNERGGRGDGESDMAATATATIMAKSAACSTATDSDYGALPPPRDGSLLSALLIRKRAEGAQPLLPPTSSLPPLPLPKKATVAPPPDDDDPAAAAAADQNSNNSNNAARLARLRAVRQQASLDARADARAYASLLRDSARGLRAQVARALEQRRAARERALRSAHGLLRLLAERAAAEAAALAEAEERERRAEGRRRAELEAARRQRFARAVAAERAERSERSAARDEAARRRGEAQERARREARRFVEEQRRVAEAKERARGAEAGRRAAFDEAFWGVKGVGGGGGGGAVAAAAATLPRPQPPTPLPGALAPEFAAWHSAGRAVLGGGDAGKAAAALENNINTNKARERGARALQADRSRAIMREVFAALDDEARREREDARRGRGAWGAWGVGAGTASRSASPVLRRSPAPTSPARLCASPRSPEHHAHHHRHLPARALAASPVLRRLIVREEERGGAGYPY